MCSGSRLSRVSMPTPSGRCALNSLATFTALASCTLHNPHHPLGRPPGRIDLLPLGSLTHLSDLSLQGPAEYTNLGAVLQNLTKLVVSDTTVDEISTCVSATKLRSLYIQNGIMSCALSPGLFACEQLQELGCINSMIAADVSAHVLCTNDEVTCIPSKITALTQLKFMEMHVAKVEEWPQAAGLFEFAWLTHLTNLQHLALRVEYDIKIPPGLSNLCKLTQCQLLLPEAAGPVLDLDWAKLVCLHTLRIVGGTLIFDHQLLRLASVTTLAEVSIDCAPNDSVSTACLAALASWLSRHAPHVKLTICGTSAADVYAKAFPAGTEL